MRKEMMSDNEKYEYKIEILSELIMRVDDWCRYGRGIDDVIIKDMCDEIRDNDNI